MFPGPANPGPHSAGVKLKFHASTNSIKLAYKKVRHQHYLKKKSLACLKFGAPAIKVEDKLFSTSAT